jgi:hypothetical protein
MANLSKWTDETSYSRGERGTIEPTTWEWNGGGLRAIVHRYHGLGGWFGTCHELRVDRRTLDSVLLDDAQEEFLSYLWARACDFADALESVRPKVPGTSRRKRRVK